MSPAGTALARSPSLVVEHLQASLFLPDLKARKKPAALEEMVAALAAAGVTRHPEAVLDSLRRREALGSTGLGKGVAVPHARSTLVAERAVLFARSLRGVEFESADGAPTRLFFLIVAPPAERDPVYLNLLADLVRAVRLAKVRRRLLEAPDFSAVRSLLRQAVDD